MLPLVRLQRVACCLHNNLIFPSPTYVYNPMNLVPMDGQPVKALRRTVLVWRAVQRCTALPSPCQPQADDSEQSDKVMTGHLTD